MEWKSGKASGGGDFGLGQCKDPVAGTGRVGLDEGGEERRRQHRSEECG